MSARRAILLADGDAPTRAGLDAAWPGWDDGIDRVVAADGGARLAGALGLRIDEWVGDGDSLGAEGIEALRASGVKVEVAAADKDETDAELGLLAAIWAGARDVTILGALGGPRFDHALANVHLLAHPATLGKTVRLLDASTRVRLLAALAAGGSEAALDLGGRIGDVVSLIPIGDVEGVTTVGLRYPLEDEWLLAGPARGLSNVRDARTAEVRIRHGRLLVVEVFATLRR
ncbi:MAG TPA: thiamine diphosphokinase [Candidatus Limnocylindrales bacterium]|nr:thiamine diphosphokinase [Candidatus Limnocylindrales bacterium]